MDYPQHIPGWKWSTRKILCFYFLLPSGLPSSLPSTLQSLWRPADPFSGLVTLPVLLSSYKPWAFHLFSSPLDRCHCHSVSGILFPFQPWLLPPHFQTTHLHAKAQALRSASLKCSAPQETISMEGWQRVDTGRSHNSRNFCPQVPFWDRKW